jgi:hypothetical protein
MLYIYIYMLHPFVECSVGRIGRMDWNGRNANAASFAVDSLFALFDMYLLLPRHYDYHYTIL